MPLSNHESQISIVTSHSSKIMAGASCLGLAGRKEGKGIVTFYRRVSWDYGSGSGVFGGLGVIICLSRLTWLDGIVLME